MVKKTRVHHGYIMGYVMVVNHMITDYSPLLTHMMVNDGVVIAYDEATMVNDG